MNNLRLNKSFRQGFVMGMPFWLALIPVAIGYVGTVQSMDFTPLQIQVASLTIYSAPIQLVLFELRANNTSSLTIFLTVLMLSLQYIVYGLTLANGIPMSGYKRFIGSYFLNDSEYAVTMVAQDQLNFSFLLGSSLSLFLAWNVLTGLAILAGQFITYDVRLFGFVVPLIFFVLIVFSVRVSLDILAVGIGIFLTLIYRTLGMGHLTILLVGLSVPLFTIPLRQLRRKAD